MPDQFLFDDSEIAATEPDGADLLLRCAAAQVERDGESGYLRGVEIRFVGARWQGTLDGCIGRLASASLTLDGERAPRRLALPWRHGGRVRAELVFAGRPPLVVESTGLRIDGDGRYAESYAC